MQYDPGAFVKVTRRSAVQHKLNEDLWYFKKHLMRKHKVLEVELIQASPNMLDCKAEQFLICSEGSADWEMVPNRMLIMPDGHERDADEQSLGGLSLIHI